MKIYAYHLKAYYEFSTLFAPAGTNIAGTARFRRSAGTLLLPYNDIRRSPFRVVSFFAQKGGAPFSGVHRLQFAGFFQPALPLLA